jgi:hypothetical protein
MLENINFLKSRPSDLITNYIYMYHVDKFLILPTYPENVQDHLSSNFGTTNPLARSAPIYSYVSSGPRTVQISLDLHRDMLYQVNMGANNLFTSESGLDSLDVDYVDDLVKELQAIALPVYSAGEKMVNPPMVAVRLGDDIYIKGVVQGGISVTYGLPIIRIGDENKYAKVSISFTVHEVDPYDAVTVMNVGSFRGIDRTLEKRLYV